jgi:hypothetical protein
MSDIPNMRSWLHNAKGKTRSSFPMENYGLTKAGYRYVGKLLNFSQPASKEIRDMMTENRKNTIAAKSRYEKELTKQKKSASATAAHAKRTDEEKERTKQKKSASGRVAKA